MGGNIQMKHILDSVHGTIEIPKEYCDKIIDSAFFQRLRRIEQNSCRSVFPSARHDRFIHSLGVFHLGSKISEVIRKKCGQKGSNILPNNSENIFETYRVACLLHDVGHTPFSHTFEDYFNRDEIEDELKKELKDDQFSSDLDNAKKKAAPHEAISAYVAIKIFRPVFDSATIDWCLLVRMITGYKYLENKIPNKSFENAMIELIHGEIIDADGLDYVCRDVWAGGYKNFSIDLDRLINSIEIAKSNNEYEVLYNSKSLNEIEAVLNIKNFQYLYVIKHHKVLIEQHLLVEAMKSAACFHLELPGNTNDERDNALRTLCNYRIFIDGIILPKMKYKLCRPTDDDFVSLMKQCNDDYYISQWFSRIYGVTSLWKSKLEYFNIFRPVFKTLSEERARTIHTILMSPECSHYLCDKLHLHGHDIVAIEVEPKVRTLDEKKIHVRLNDEIRPYSELNHDMFSVIGEKLPYCYMYINLKQFEEQDKNKAINTIINYLKDFLINALRESWNI